MAASVVLPQRLTDRPAAWQQIAARQPEVSDVPQTQTASQVELFENILVMLRSTVQNELSPQDLMRLRHNRVVQIAEDYALAHPIERVHVTDLCEATGVSERTLQYAFNQILGMPPVAFLNKLRLHQVRRALRAATHASTTVTKESLRWGFWHFGEFARAYKKCFGELPSDTLRRPPDAGE